MYIIIHKARIKRFSTKNVKHAYLRENLISKVRGEEA